MTAKQEGENPAAVGTPAQSKPTGNRKKPRRNYSQQKPGGKKSQQNPAKKNERKQGGAAQGKPQQNKNNSGPQGSEGKETRARNVVTKKPAWQKDGSPPPSPSAGKGKTQAENRNDSRRRNDRSRKPADHPASKTKVTQPDENGIVDFTEAELAEDTALQVVSRNRSEVKFANFEEYLKNQ